MQEPKIFLSSLWRGSRDNWIDFLLLVWMTWWWPLYRKANQGISLAVQWLRLHTNNAEGVGSIPGLGTKISHTAEQRSPLHPQLEKACNEEPTCHNEDQVQPKFFKKKKTNWNSERRYIQQPWVDNKNCNREKMACFFVLKLTLKETATHSSTLAWRIPSAEEPGRLQSISLQSWTWLSD